MNPYDILENGVLLMAIGAVFLVALMAMGIMKGKQAQDELKKDDNKAGKDIKGKVLEKTTETKHVNSGIQFDYTIEWILLECEDNSRLRLRNLTNKGIILTAGDEGTFTVRGETIYSFAKKNAEKTEE